MVIIAIMDNNKPQVETFAQVEQVIRFSFRPSISHEDTSDTPALSTQAPAQSWNRNNIFRNMQLDSFQFQNKNNTQSLLSSTNAIFSFLLLCSV